MLHEKDKAVVKSFVAKLPLDGRILSTDGHSLHKLFLGGEKVAVWRGSRIAVVSSESVKSDEVILRYLVKVAGKRLVTYPYARKEHDVSLTFSSGGDQNGDQWDGWIAAYVPDEKKAVGVLYWTYWRHEYSIKMIDVRPEYKRSGIATAIYRELFRTQRITAKDLEPVSRTDEGQLFRSRAILAAKIVERLLPSAPANWDAAVKQMDLLRKRIQGLRKKVTDLDSVPPLFPKFIAFGEQAVAIAETTLEAQELAAASLTNSRLTDHLTSARKNVADLENLNRDPLRYKSNISYLYGTAMDIPYHYDRILKDLWHNLRGAASYIKSLSL